MGDLKKLIDSLSTVQRVTIVLTALLVGAGIVGFVKWKHENDFKPLYTNMALTDAGTVVQKLKEAGVEYRLGENGTSVLVPSARLSELRLDMAAAGLPKSGRIGFELFDKMNFGATEFVEHVNYRRALEGELERSIMTVTEVEQARVHLTFPKDSVFLENREPAKASVMLRLRSGNRMPAQNIAAISNLVASAVEGLNPTAVSIIDMQGNLLSRPRRQNPGDGSEATQELLDFRQQMERDLVSKVNATLEPLLGPERFRVGASVDCDFSSGDQSEETFDPNKSVMVSSQKTEDSSTGSGAAGVPGTSSSLPNPTSRPATSLSGINRRTESISYQSSRVVKHTRLPQGSVKRMSLSVLLDQNVQWEGAGSARKKVLVPPSPETLKAIHDLVAGVTGLSPDRGDQLIIESLPFESTLSLEPPPVAPSTPTPAPVTRLPRLQDLMHNKVVLISSGAGLLLLIGLVVILIRVAKRRKIAIQHEIAVTQALPAASEEGVPSETIEPAIEQAALTPPTPEAHSVEGLAQRIREAVVKEPTAPAGVIRGWLNES
ncbi:MAG: flagellar basal-body MS-ring/collar protein FliF [Bryobacteraceae bacterium]